MSRRKTAKRSTKPDPKLAALKPEHAAMLVTGSPFDGTAHGIRKDATIGDVVNMMFWSATEDTGNDEESFMRTVVASVRDELAVLGLAAEGEGSIDELSRIAERLSHRLLFAQWLADKMNEARKAAASVEGGAS